MTPNGPDPGSDLLSIYRMMLLIRRFEERATQYFLNGQIRGSFHPVHRPGGDRGRRGLRAPAATTTCSAPTAATATPWPRGSTRRRRWRNCWASGPGCSKGKGSSMHFTDPRVGLLGENAIVGAGVPIAAGAALRAQLDKTGQVAMTVFGDGALNQGALARGVQPGRRLEAPARHRLREQPLLRDDPDQGHGRPRPPDSTAPAGFGIPAVVADGYDPVAMLETTRGAVERARRGEGPQFIEAMTYRLVGHMVGDTEPYRTKEEVAEWRAQRPDRHVPAAPGRPSSALSQAAVDEVDAVGRGGDGRDRPLRRGEPLARAAAKHSRMCGHD